MRIEEVTVTPAMAREWLKANTQNRPLVASTVEGYAKAIRAGHWQLTHQGIAFSVSGRLIDGQHRLSAIVKADVPVRMVVIHDAPENSFDVLDRGRTRSISDVIRRPRQHAEVVTQIYKVATGSFAVDPVAIANVHPDVWRQVEALHEYAPTTARFLTVVGVRAGAVLRMLAAPARALWVMDQYRHLTHADFSNLKPSLNAFVRQLMQKNSKNGYDITLRSFRAFDYDTADKERIVIKDTAPILQEISAIAANFGMKREAELSASGTTGKRGRSRVQREGHAIDSGNLL